MVVDFSRNVKDFAVNRYAQIVPVDKMVGYYMKMTVEQAGRLVNSNLADLQWPDGNESPDFNDGTESHEYLAYAAKRIATGFNIGYLTSEQATWDIIAAHSRIHAQRMMTARTLRAITAATTSGNYDSTHVSAVTGGSITGVSTKWDVSTTAAQSIKRSLNHAAELILKDTLAAIDINDLVVVISPGLARKLAVAQEIVDHIKGSPDALPQIRGELAGGNSMFGLPDKLYGFPLVVEKTVRVSTQKGATTSRGFVLPDTTPFMCARPGGLVGVEGAPSFSTITIFMKEEMTIETKDDPDNRRTKGRITENYDTIVTAPVTGFLFTGACD
jgi:hypothetical protein